ncbi:OmpA family protein [Dyadobacter sp. CY261]|uniref:OmpA family protein n=1 Tax=Dyadobacter sp. CY261 TaxID=2907203 RepID=UPI001F382F7D|nr:OmpA family protein [Dyadobacter sp. CY261]MCF0069445.1 OmpA family protein [Dyadobacter sp. CY261]
MKTFTAITLLFFAVYIPATGQHAVDATASSKSSRPIIRTTRIAIRVLDKFTLKPVHATVMVVGKRPENPVTPRVENGVYQFKIAAKDTSVISIYANGYHMLSEIVAASKLNTTRVIYLTPVENAKASDFRPLIDPGRPLLADEITAVLHFPQSEAEILPESGYELEILADYLVRNSTSRIELTGHTDDVGDPFKNVLLSFDRVDVVKKYLLSRNITTDRIRGKGFGSDLPIAPNDCEANRRLNRRVEIKIVP